MFFQGTMRFTLAVMLQASFVVKSFGTSREAEHRVIPGVESEAKKSLLELLSGIDPSGPSAGEVAEFMLNPLKALQLDAGVCQVIGQLTSHEDPREKIKENVFHTVINPNTRSAMFFVHHKLQSTFHTLFRRTKPRLKCKPQGFVPYDALRQVWVSDKVQIFRPKPKENWRLDFHWEPENPNQLTSPKVWYWLLTGYDNSGNGQFWYQKVAFTNGKPPITFEDVYECNPKLVPDDWHLEGDDNDALKDARDAHQRRQRAVAAERQRAETAK